MCGFAGFIALDGELRTDQNILSRMTNRLLHRGPDSSGYYVAEGVGLGFRRLSIIDLETGDQPIYNEDGTVVLMCNGEIYNFRELAHELEQKGHQFRTKSDVEVLVHLYEEDGPGFVEKLNGQFAFVIYDAKEKRLLLARDHFGVNPLYYTVTGGLLIFASEIKAILEHPLAPKEVDLTGLDQTLSFPGLVSPRTMFKGIEALKSGHFLEVKNSTISVREYWDLDYPRDGDLSYEHDESFYVERLSELLEQSVRYRLQADVPVGFYLSGGLDSSLIAAMIKHVSPKTKRHSFSIGFNDKGMCEAPYQRIMAQHTGSVHHEIIFDWPEIAERLSTMLYHAECPVKESYNTCSMALSEAARQSGITVILTGEGADELFAGYVGYRFDRFRTRDERGNGLEAILEGEIRERLWGDKDLFYEKDHYAFRDIKSALYAECLSDQLPDFDCVNFDLVNKDKLRGRHFVHQRSYLDLKLRLSDHLITDHGDKMALANSVEGRYPFLDIELVEFSRQIPPDLKLNNYTEKYILRKIAERFVPPEIIKREKFGFHAPGSPYLLRQNIEWINDTLSFERIKRQGYFNPHIVEKLKEQYSQDGFKLSLPFEDDLLIVVLTFGMFLDLFNLPSLN